MYCTNCGVKAGESNKFCTNCGAPISERVEQTGGEERGPPVGGESTAPPHVPNYLVQAILVTIFCCLPLGIVSIVYAAQVNGHVAAGNIDGARRSSNLAKKWAWITFSVGIVATIVWVAAIGIASVLEIIDELGTL